MRDPIGELSNALETGRSGILIVWYPDGGLRDEIVDEVASLLPEPPAYVTSAEDAILRPAEVVFVLAADEALAVEDLDGGRDRTLEPRRSGPHHRPPRLRGGPSCDPRSLARGLARAW